MSTSKELVELTELYKNIQLQELGPFKDLVNNKNKETNKDKQDNKKENELNDVLNKLKSDKKDDKDDKDKIEGPNININKSNSKSNKTDDKTDKKQDTGSFFKGSGQNPENFKNPEAQAEYLKLLKDKNVNPAEIDTSKYFKDTSNNKSNSDDEKGANEWGPGGQPSASKQIDAYKKGRPSPASFKTNQRQTRELIKQQSKEVYPTVTKQDLNQFNRTKKYTADDGSQVERSTVFTKHYKTGKPLGVMTGSQRKAYDKAAAAYKAQSTPTPKPVETKPVETKPDTYKTNIGAFLNNKKKGDVKDKSRHTKVASVLDIEDSYDAKAPQVESYAAKVLVKGTGELGKRVAKKMAGTKDAPKQKMAKPKDAPKQSAPSRKAPQDAPTAPSRPDKAPNAPSRPKPSTGPSGGESQRKKPKTDKAQTATQDAPKQQESYDAYDLVLDYIIETNQASSIEEANYIMMEMDQNTIHEIVQAQKKTLAEGIKTAVGLGMLALPYAMSQLEKRWNPVKNKRKEYQNKKATEYEKKSGTTKEDGYFR